MVSPRDTCKYCNKSFMTRYTRKRHEDTGVCQKGKKECQHEAPEETSSSERRSKVGKILVERAILNPTITSIRNATFLMNRAELSEMKQNLVQKLEKITYKWAIDVLKIIPENRILLNEIKEIMSKYKLLKADDTWGNRNTGHYVLLSDGVAIKPTDTYGNDLIINRLEDFMKEPEYIKRKTKPLPEQNKLETQLLYGEPEPQEYKELRAYQGFYRDALDENGKPKIAKLNKTDYQLLKNRMSTLRKNIDILTQISKDQMHKTFDIVRPGIGIHVSPKEDNIFTTDSTPFVIIRGPLPNEEGPAEWFVNLIFPNEEDTSAEKEEGESLGYPRDEILVAIRSSYKQPDAEFIKKMTNAAVLIGLYPNIPEKIIIHVVYPKNKKSKLPDPWKDLELDIRKTEDGKNILMKAEGTYTQPKNAWARFVHTIPKELRELSLAKKGGKVQYKK